MNGDHRFFKVKDVLLASSDAPVYFVTPHAIGHKNYVDGGLTGNCPLISAGEDCLGRCAEEGITYKAICTLCETEQQDEPEVIQSQYVGESFRTLLVQSSQHFKD